MKLATAHVALQTTLSAAREFQQACACHRSTIRRCAFLPRSSPSRGKSARKSVLTKYFVLFPSLTLPYNARFRQVVGSVTSSFGTNEVKNWLEVLNTWIFEDRGWQIKG